MASPSRWMSATSPSPRTPSRPRTPGPGPQGRLRPIICASAKPVRPHAAGVDRGTALQTPPWPPDPPTPPSTPTARPRAAQRLAKLVEGVLKQVEPHAFLFESHVRAEVAAHEAAIYSGFIRRECAERPVGGRISLHPLPAVLQESGPVHQDRLCVREGPAQPVKDGKAADAAWLSIRQPPWLLESPACESGNLCDMRPVSLLLLTAPIECAFASTRQEQGCTPSLEGAHLADNRGALLTPGANMLRVRSRDGQPGLPKRHELPRNSLTSRIGVLAGSGPVRTRWGPHGLTTLSAPLVKRRLLMGGAVPARCLTPPDRTDISDQGHGHLTATMVAPELSSG